MRNGAVEREAGIDVSTKELLLYLPRLGRQEVQPLIGAPDGVGLFDDQLAARVETGGRAGKGEREQQTHEAEHGALDGTDALAHALAVPAPVALAEAPPQLEEDDHAHEEPGGEQRTDGDLTHGSDPES
jgi:hypothetical protein